MVRQETTGFEYDAWIASACMPSSLIRQILVRFGDSAACHEAFQRKDPDIHGMIPPRFCRILQENASAEQLKVYAGRMKEHDIRVIRQEDPHYPADLSEIDDPPPILFYQGDLSCLSRRIIAMVGSRAASYAGLKATSALARDLSRRGVEIVSGLACGIDAAAHQGCIEGGSPTIAVTGCGLDRVYPSDNRMLRDRILERGGILLSEYAPGEKPAGWHFPVRNRIITGIARALVLMEARIRSGSMTSVQHALDQGRDVFVYPGDPAMEQFEGNHRLLREGAIYFTGAEDILEDLGWLDNPFEVRHNIDCPAADVPLSPEQALIAGALKPGTLSFEELLKHTGLDPSVLMGGLTVLQISGIIEALPGKQYRLKQ